MFSEKQRIKFQIRLIEKFIRHNISNREILKQRNNKYEIEINEKIIENDKKLVRQFQLELEILIEKGKF